MSLPLTLYRTPSRRHPWDIRLWGLRSIDLKQSTSCWDIYFLFLCIHQRMTTSQGRGERESSAKRSTGTESSELKGKRAFAAIHIDLNGWRTERFVLFRLSHFNPIELFVVAVCTWNCLVSISRFKGIVSQKCYILFWYRLKAWEVSKPLLFQPFLTTSSFSYRIAY
jgi:hypothetical protein